MGGVMATWRPRAVQGDSCWYAPAKREGGPVRLELLISLNENWKPRLDTNSIFKCWQIVQFVKTTLGAALAPSDGPCAQSGLAQVLPGPSLPQASMSPLHTSTEPGGCW